MTEAIVFTPKKEKIIVKPIWRSRNSMITDPKHEAYFLFGNSTVNYVLPLDRFGNLINPFSSKEEQNWLEKELDLDLNIYRKKDNPWHKLKVPLGKNPITLNLQDPKQYLEYLILKANNLYIAPNHEVSKLKATYRYEMVSENHEVEVKSTKADKEIEAYMALGKLRENKSDMINFLKIYGKKVSEVSKPEFLLGELKKIVEEDLERFLDITRDKDNYDLKLLIAEAVECSAIFKVKREYTLPGGDKLCDNGDVSTLEKAIEFLKNPKNQDILTTIKARVEKSRE